MCYIHNSLKVRILQSSSGQVLNDPEYLLLEIINPNICSLLFTCIYRRPKGHLLTDFLNVFNNYSHAYKNIIISGDLNCNLLSDDVYSRHLRHFVQSQSLYLVPSDATHHTASSDSWLDVFIIDHPSKLNSFSKSSEPFIAGHDYIIISYSFDTKTYCQKVITRRSLNSFNVESFLETLSNKLPISVNIDYNSSVVTDNKFSTFSLQLLTEIDTYAPLKTFLVKKLYTPWLTADLKERIKLRTKLYKKAKRTNNILDRLIYRHYKNKLTIDMRKARSDYIYHRLNNINNPTEIWRELSSLGLVKVSFSSPLHFFDPEQLNSSYQSVSTLYPECTIPQLESIVSNNPIRTDLAFCFSQVSQLMIDTLINKLPNSHCFGPDRISAFFLKISLPKILPQLTSFFNNFIEFSYFPSIWKQSFIRPVSKNGTPLSPSDTRPIVNLSELSKIFERILFNQIMQYISSNNILDDKQSAYRTGFSTQTALLEVVNFVDKGIDEGLITIMVLFDFSKAFDTIRHCLLLKKLRLIGFSDTSLRLIFSYLSNRTQAVINEYGKPSTWLNTTTGVPQGSVLGPLLFILFINDIGSVIKSSKHMIYADDTQILFHVHPSFINQGLRLVSEDVEAIYKYSEENCLKLNISKTKILLLGSRRFASEIDISCLPSISVNGTTIPYVTKARNLGVIFSSDLSWKNHISFISSKVHGTLYKLKYHKLSLPQDIRIKLVTTLIFPHLDYCCLVYNGVTKELNIKLQRLINCCIRFIFDLRRDVHITPFRHQLGWLSVEHRRLYFLGIMTYKIISSRTPNYLYRLFNFHDSSLRRSSRVNSSETFSIPSHRTSSYRNSFVLAAIYWWHSLPISITLSNSLSSFKTNLHSYLKNLDRQQNES